MPDDRVIAVGLERVARISSYSTNPADACNADRLIALKSLKLEHIFQVRGKCCCVQRTMSAAPMAPA